MEGKDRAFWFALGYLACFVLDVITEEISNLLSSLESDGTNVIIESSNGNKTETGETVSSLVKEDTESV